MGTVLDLLDLPTDIFLMVTHYLNPIEFVRCRLVSKSWHREFTNESILRDVLVRECGEANEVHALLDLEAKQTENGPSEDDYGQFRTHWRGAFDRILARKLAIKSGRPRSVTKQDLHNGLTHLLEKHSVSRDGYIPVFPWARYHK